MISPRYFWADQHFDFDDALNEEIWRLSTRVQLEIDSYEVLQAGGAIGAQQCMLRGAMSGSGSVLPWVPDLVGQGWRNGNGVTIVGAAYAGFIEEYSRRSAVMPLTQYLDASSVRQFQLAFLHTVVRQDENYYEPLAKLCSHLGSASQIAVLDLCRASLVKRGVGEFTRADSSSSRDVSTAIAKYVEHPQAADWLWRRFTSDRARCLVALGFTAEHGLLRLFHQRGMRVMDGDRLWKPRTTRGPWPTNYADSNRHIGYWRENAKWWTVRGDVNGTERMWLVLPVCHPARHSVDDAEYEKTAPVLKKMQAAALAA